ncbi:G-protein coupled receptor family C group 6 member A-like [Rhinatrema bivittatum]|uniref:G-protein coupled receptor family C group 6 member A-like n=1 Tax=Rhinatrema bivittatum TaxID=194408 RepID=UPI0011285CCE|nr:G-protein coupled receptor family C group 6 member A-like [Rhinatrema bivittatum]
MSYQSQNSKDEPVGEEVGTDLVTPCSSPDGYVARLPGHVIIGGLFPIHSGVSNLPNRTYPDDFTCTGFDIRHFIRTLAMIHTIERINNSTLLPGITLGYEIYDTCADVFKAYQGTMRFISKYNSSERVVPVKCNYSDYNPLVKAIVGAGFSEVSIAVAKILSFYLIPQISHASTAAILSDKMRFPSFLRTVPSDFYQTKAVAMLLSEFKWNWVGVIATDDDYGRAAAESLKTFFEEQAICIAFQQLLPSYVTHSEIDAKISSVIGYLKNTTAKVIVTFLKSQLVNKLFPELIKHNISRIWVAGAVWATSRDVAALENIDKVGTILGFSYKNTYIDGFSEYLQSLQPGPNAINSFIEEYKELRFGCTEEYREYKNCLNTSTKTCNISDATKFKSPLVCSVKNESLANDDFLMKNIELGGSYGAYLAVTAIAQAIRKLICSNGTCDAELNFSPWQLLQTIKKTNISQNDGPFYFDTFGDSINGYDLLYWQRVNGSIYFKVIGKYELNKSYVEINQTLILWDPVNNEVPVSKCSNSCIPGEYKQYSNISCCYDCDVCPEGHYSRGYDMHECLKCPQDQWSNNGSASCQNKTVEFLMLHDPFAIVLTSFAILGFLIVAAITFIFVKHHSTPAVKSAGGIYSCVMNIALLLSFVSIGFFIVQPSDIFCQLRQTLYGISFTLCVACIVLKSLRILLAFEFGEKVQSHMKITYQPAMVIIVLTIIQMLICTIWLILKPPSLHTIYTMPRKIILQCDEGSLGGFGVMLGYIGLLAFICFILAYKGRKLPGRYNEARFITFSMLTFLFVWIAFIPIYISTEGIYLSAVQVVAILASNYAIISCHLLPTCYIIFFKKSSNNRIRYIENIHTFLKKTISIYSVSVSEIPCSFEIPSPRSQGHQIHSQPGHGPTSVMSVLRKRRGSW